jgi:hypothetical protein
VNRKLSLYSFVVVVFFGALGFVLFGSSVRHIVLGGSSLGELRGPIMTVAEFPSLVKTLFNFEPQLSSNRFPDFNGLRKSGQIPPEVKSDDGYLLLGHYDKQEGQATVRLLRIRDEKLIYKWIPKFSELIPLQSGKSKYSHPIGPKYSEILHPLLLKDGGLIFHFRYAPLFKINACSAVEWSIDGVFHHSIEQNEEGDIWVGSMLEPSSYSGTGLTHLDHTITKISPRGKVLYNKSVARILDENGYRGLLAAGYPTIDSNPIHLNDIQPALKSSEFWKQGDLLLSVRGLSTVFLYRPDTDKVIWLKTGPWMNQHDVNFIEPTSISVFGNDVIFVPPNPDLRQPSREVLKDGHNNIYIFDFKTNSLNTPYSKLLKEKEVRTVTSGRAGMLQNGDFLVEESNYGRLLRITPERVKWELVNTVDVDYLTPLRWVRYLTPAQVEPILPKLQKSICGE